MNVWLRETSSTPIINIIAQWIRHPVYQETVNVTERTLLQRGLWRRVILYIGMDVFEESAIWVFRVAEEPACEEHSRKERQLKTGANREVYEGGMGTTRSTHGDLYEETWKSVAPPAEVITLR